MCPGITIPTLESWLTLSNGTGVSGVVRTIPNTPVSLRQGATAVIASQRVTAVQLDRVVDLFRIISPCVGRDPVRGESFERCGGHLGVR
jgi:pyrroline-5-carboxylate reductase